MAMTDVMDAGDGGNVEPSDQRMAEDQQKALADKLSGIVQGWTKEVNERISRKRQIEERWLQDLRQYHGMYEDHILRKLKEREGSELYLNVTRNKTNTAAAKLYDMLFPTDDKNWGIEATPVPSLNEEIGAAMKMGPQIAEQANQMLASGMEAEAQQMIDEASPVLSKANELREQRDKAQARADRMASEIDDQLKECDYNSEARKAIEEACQIGTGIMIGPIKARRPKRRWVEDPQSGGMRLEEDHEAMRGGLYHHSAWHFFPDPDVAELKDSRENYARHLYNTSKMRQFAREPGVFKDAVRRLIAADAREESPSFMADLRTMTNGQTDNAGRAFHVFQYFGYLEAQQIVDMARAAGREDMAADYEDEDPLVEFPIVAWFCQGELLKIGEHPMDTGDILFSAFCWQRDPGSIFGYGVPYTMRDQQAAICATWREIMDNAALSASPQVVIDKTSVEPEESNDWRLKPRKTWYVNRPMPANSRVFSIEHIDAKIGELMAIIEAAMRFIDDETGINQLAQGEQGAGVTKTAQGMALLMNSTNVVFRRIVSHFDDYMTKPNIRRMHDWTMQWSEDESVRGDFEIVARGASVLLVQEIQSQNMMTLFSLALSDPELREMTDMQEAYRAVVKAMKVPVEQWVLTDEQLEQIVAQKAAQPPAPDPEMIKLEIEQAIAELKASTDQQVAQIKSQTDLQLAQIKSQTDLQLAESDRQLKSMEIAQRANVELDRADAKLRQGAMQIEHKERTTAAEIAVAEQTGKHGGGNI